MKIVIAQNDGTVGETLEENLQFDLVAVVRNQGLARADLLDQIVKALSLHGVEDWTCPHCDLFLEDCSVIGRSSHLTNICPN